VDRGLAVLALRSLTAPVRQGSESEDWVDWVEQADRLWAAELGVSSHVLRTDGFHVFEGVGAAARPRVTIVGTSSATVVSLGAGRAHMFETAGLSLEQMRQSPRRYVAACPAIHSLKVRGPAYLAYWPPSFPRRALRGRTELVGGDGWASLASLRDIAPAEWEEELLETAISEALADNLLPQYRARDDNAPSLALAKRVGFVEHGWMATVFVRLPGNPVQQAGARDARPGG